MAILFFFHRISQVSAKWRKSREKKTFLAIKANWNVQMRKNSENYVDFYRKRKRNRRMKLAVIAYAYTHIYNFCSSHAILHTSRVLHTDKSGTQRKAKRSLSLSAYMFFILLLFFTATATSLRIVFEAFFAFAYTARRACSFYIRITLILFEAFFVLLPLLLPLLLLLLCARYFFLLIARAIVHHFIKMYVHKFSYSAFRAFFATIEHTTHIAPRL